MMEFFREFRQLAKTVEKDVQDIQENMTSTPQYQMRNQEKEECVGNAILVARNLQEDVKAMKKEIRTCKKSLQDDGGFLELAAISQALIQKQAEIIGQIEQHIQQYGYQPMNKELPKHQDNAINQANENPEETNDADITEMNEENKENIPGTPEKKGSSNNEDNVKTPKLEDFGLSKDIMNYYRQLGENMRKQINQGNQEECISSHVFKESHSVAGATQNINTLCYQETPVKKSDAFEEPYCAVPEYFNHAGLVPTPGFTGGRDKAFSQDQDDSLPSETPFLLKSRSQTKSLQNSEQNGESNTSFDIPVPPVLNTPGIKQIEKYDRSKVDPLPSFRLNESDTTDSPIPPVLQTPGIKQLPKSSDIVINKDTKPPAFAEKLEVIEDDSPMPPVLCTPGVKQISKYRGKEKTNVMSMLSDTIAYDSDDDIPEMPELTYSWTDLQRIKTQYEKDSTSNIQRNNFGTSPSAQKTICKTVNERKMMMPPSVMNQNLEDSPVPSMPELTGTYNFNRPYDVFSTETEKENVGPQNSKNNMTDTIRLQLITQEEYDNQPDYVHRLLSLTTLNRTINTIDKLFAQKLSEGRRVCVAESDLQPVLGPTTKSLLLVMIRLGRLRESYNKGQCHDLCFIPV